MHTARVRQLYIKQRRQKSGIIKIYENERQVEYMGNVYVFDHPLIQHKTALLRKEETSVKDFRELVREISTLMGYEATRKLPLEEVQIKTPMQETTVKMLKARTSRSYLS